MNELQVTINNLKEMLIAGELVLAKIEKAKKDLEESQIPEFPDRFTIVKDKETANSFIIALPAPAYAWITLPGGFLGRAGYSKNELGRIILGIQTLLGDK